MYELIQVGPASYYIQSPAKIGLVETEPGQVVLIDSGNDKDAGRKVRQVLDAKGWKLTAIYNTHSNADHIGGNRYLQGQTGCKIFAPAIEEAFTLYPVLEPAFLYGGYPPKELRHKFLMAQPSTAQVLRTEDLPQGMEVIDLPGHYFNMVGFRTADDTVYLADCLSSKETLEKYKICFLYDPGAYVATLEKVKEMEGRFFVPAHAEATEDIRELAQLNIDSALGVAEDLEDMCKCPRSFEEILKKVFDDYGLVMSLEQNALIGSTIRSYLGWLLDQGRLRAGLDGNVLRWERV